MLPGIERVTLPLSAERAFDEIIDVRSPGEFAEDHITGSINLPVLSDEERIEIGTQFKQESKFAAVKSGAALIYKNLSRHLETHFTDKPKDYLPLVYCWRGGQRSESLATVLQAIGWQVALVDGGYKTYRRQVIDGIESNAGRLTFHIINGLTGCGKTRLLHELKSQGAQILDLEGLANHKGSVFGGDPDNLQPAQKRFESLLFDKISCFDEDFPVFVEAESPKIGRLNIPNDLWQKLRESPVSELTTTPENRIQFLREDYDPWLTDQARVALTIDRLHGYHSKETLENWKSMAARCEWETLIGSLLEKHYDQHYKMGGSGHYDKPVRTLELADQGDTVFEKCASDLIGLVSI